MARTRDNKGRFVKGVADSTFGAPAAETSSPKVVKNTVNSLTPIEAYLLCSAVRTAVRARNESFGQVKIRLFTKSGREILDGDNISFWKRPNPSQTGQNFIQAVATWNDLAGERVAWVHPEAGKYQAHPLNPFSMRVVDPMNPRLPELIKKFQYTWENSDQQFINSENVVFQHDFNPSSLVRGTSPLIAVVNSITASYQAQRYIKSFFGNNATPGGIMSFETDNADLIEPFKKEFLSQHQGDANAWKMWFVAGGKANFTPTEQPLEDSPFQQLMANVQSEVAALYMTPPLHAGQFDKTRFDSVKEQNNFFFESVFIPRVQVIQDFCQQLQDSQLRFTGGSKYREITNMSKSLHDRFEKAKATADSDVVVVLDIDHIPSVAALRQSKIEYAQKLQEVFHVTPREAAAEVGMELELNSASDLVWHATSQRFLEKPQAAAPAAPAPAPAAPAPQEPEADSEESDNVKTFFRSLRKLTLDKMDAGSKWTLAEADALAKEHGVDKHVHIEIRKDYQACSLLCQQKDKAGIKAHFNQKNGRYIRSLVKGNN